MSVSFALNRPPFDASEVIIDLPQPSSDLFSASFVHFIDSRIGFGHVRVHFLDTRVNFGASFDLLEYLDELRNDCD